ETELTDVKRLSRICASALPAAKTHYVTHWSLLIVRALAPGTAQGTGAGCRGFRQARSLGRSG
ncbi:MAG: hypothetical protein ACLQRM_01765, partial [Acidimicrobiales bacterium]